MTRRKDQKKKKKLLELIVWTQAGKVAWTTKQEGHAKTKLCAWILRKYRTMDITDFLIALVVRMPSFMNVKIKNNHTAWQEAHRLRKTII